ncbi:MAG: hypothetical protein HY515_02060 [Candidatus Aenigmarchaeota archaeon]|nr:hypothetical protein [Candidatus Aenigmarchaeota archaeon]
MSERLTDEYHLKGIFYNIYDIGTVGVRPQMQLVEALATGERIEYIQKPPNSSPSGLIRADGASNLFTNCLTIVKIFDPSTLNDPVGMKYAPPEYLGEDSPRIREMKVSLDRLKRTGRSFALRTLAGLEASLSQPEITEEEAEEIAKALNSKKFLYTLLEGRVCVNFVSATGGVIAGMERAIYEHWNTEGRGERTLYHAAKLGLMNAITDAAIRKARAEGMDPNAFTRNDSQHVEYWKEAFNETVPTPEVLLARSRAVVDAARQKYLR